MLSLPYTLYIYIYIYIYYICIISVRPEFIFVTYFIGGNTFLFQRYTIHSKSINANYKWLLVLKYYSGSFSDCSDSQARGQERRMGLVPKSLKVFISQPSISLLIFMLMPTCHLCPPKNALLSPLFLNSTFKYHIDSSTL